MFSLILRFPHFWNKNLSSAKILALGFGSLILVGTLLLMIPACTNPGYQLGFLDCLFTATSAVCVTGLSVSPTSATFSIWGKIVLGFLIQFGGMGIALLMIGFLIYGGEKVGFRSRALLVSAQNLFGYNGLGKLARTILNITFGVELAGAFASFFVFIQDYDFFTSVGYAIFHSISAFNNAGFDIFGGSDSMLVYANNIPMNLITSFLVIIGGFGFIPMIDLYEKKGKITKCLLTTRITLFMTTCLLITGTLFFWFFSEQTFLEAFFQSVIARTAGFATFPLSRFGPAALSVFMVLMFIGASPNSTGGGVKTNTVFCAALKAYSATAQHDEDEAFFRRIPAEAATKSFIVILYGFTIIFLAMLLILIVQPTLGFEEVLVEAISAFATVGSSMGITSQLNWFSKLVVIFCMFAGRLGPITIANLLVSKRERKVEYSEGKVLIG